MQDQFMFTCRNGKSQKLLKELSEAHERMTNNGESFACIHKRCNYIGGPGFPLEELVIREGRVLIYTRGKSLPLLAEIEPKCVSEELRAKCKEAFKKGYQSGGKHGNKSGGKEHGNK